MDGTRERLLATLIGAIGTVLGVVVIQMVPEMVRQELELRYPAVWWFLIMVVGVGACGGFVGHWVFLNVASGDLQKRALIVGGAVGLAIGAVTWSLTYLLFDTLFPFHVLPGAKRALVDRVLTNALLAGPLGGVLVALAVQRRVSRSAKS